MRHKRVILALSALLLGLLALLGLRRVSERASVSSDDDYKELYRESMHTLTADMEAIQRKRRNAQS